MYISKIKSECGIAQLGLPLFILQHMSNLSTSSTPMTSSTIQHPYFQPIRAPDFVQAGRPEIAMYGGRSHDLKKRLQFWWTHCMKLSLQG